MMRLLTLDAKRTRLAALLTLALAPALVVSTLGCGAKSAETPAAQPVPAYATALRPKIEASLKDTLSPGAVVWVRSTELGDWAEAFGTRAYGGGEKISVDDHHRIGSNTKTMTGTVILQLVEEGKLKLDDPVSKYRPDVTNDKITITHLLDMRSGIYNYSEALELNTALDQTPDRVWQPEELVKLGLSKPALFEPGTSYSYSNTNTVLLGLIIEQLTKNPLEQELQTRIFDKLGLKHTSLPKLGDGALPVPHPRGYAFGTNVEKLTTETLSPERQAAVKAGTLLPTDFTDANPSWGWAAGAAISTAPELGRYAQALVGGELLGAAMHKQRLESIIPSDPAKPDAAGYGLGIAKLGPMYGHTGELPGFNTFMGHDPAKKITLITWCPLAAAPDGRPPAIEIAKMVIAELYATPPTGVAAPSKPGAGD